MSSKPVNMINNVGISCTPELKGILEEIITECSGNIQQNNDEKDGRTTEQNVQNTKSMQEALESMLANNTGDSSSEHVNLIPLRVIGIAKSIVTSPTSLQKLNRALEKTQLKFPKPTKPAQSQAYKKRISKLKLAEQERKYTKLTKNLDNSKADDATIKSMMYAATIGVNMIVAPISIGVLMYFFAGKLFEFITPGYERDESRYDIRGVIAGVVAGVLMLFIEMILFVIRNHEMDKFITKKMKKHKNPFGYDAQTASRTYQGELG